MYALNLTHSPEKSEFWDGADPLIIGAGNTGGAILTSAGRHPGVADSIELDNDSGVTRRASEKLPKGSWRDIPVVGTAAEYGRPTWKEAARRRRCEGWRPVGPQRFSDEAANPRRAKVSTVNCP